MVTRRHFLQHAATAAAGIATAPLILTPRRVRARAAAGGTLAFRPYNVQRGRGPHLLDWAYASDSKWDAFHSNITASSDTGVVISDTEGQSRFAINPRWNVEGFGYIFITADNGGELYELPPEGQSLELNLNYELAKSRVHRNRRRLSEHTSDGWAPSRAVQGYVDVSEGYLEDAMKAGDEYRRGALAQSSLMHAMWASEMLELERAEFLAARLAPRTDFFVGCDARTFYQMDGDLFMDLFEEVFNYATITHYAVHNGMPDFEPTQGDKRFDTRDVLLERLRSRGITVEGRPLFYPYETVTPDWLRHMKYDDLLRYVEQHVREVVGHYGERMYAWEIVNEIHDWANEVQITPDQAIELTP